MRKIMCRGCDGKEFVNLARMKSGEIFTDETETVVHKCLICKGKGKVNDGFYPKN